MSHEQLRLLDNSETVALLREIRDIVRVDEQGEPTPTATHRHLVRAMALDVDEGLLPFLSAKTSLAAT